MRRCGHKFSSCCRLLGLAAEVRQIQKKGDALRRPSLLLGLVLVQEVCDIGRGYQLERNIDLLLDSFAFAKFDRGLKSADGDL